MNSYNLYAYCGNNPVMYIDPSGELAISISMLICGIIIGALASGAIDAGIQLSKNGGDFQALNWGSIANSAITGAALGMSTALGVGYLGPMIAGTATFGAKTIVAAFSVSVGISALSGGVGYVLQQSINKDSINALNVIGHASTVALEGAFNFGVGGMIGSMEPTIGTNGKAFISKEWYTKFIITQEFSNGIKIPLDRLRKELRG